MKRYLVLLGIAMFLISTANAFAQQSASTPIGGSAADVAFWVNHWSQPRVVLFGPEQENFYKNMHEIMFPWNEFDRSLNPSALDANVQYLMDHPKLRFYIFGYACSRGEQLYNLVLSGRRAEWVKQALVSKGIPEDRIAMVVGWGQLYPVCADLNEECWSKNRLVRFEYSPD